jgi:hypothetical protein
LPPFDCEISSLQIDLDGFASYNARLVERSRNDCCVAQGATLRGHNSVGREHPPDILRTCRRADQDDIISGGYPLCSTVGIKNGYAMRLPWRGPGAEGNRLGSGKSAFVENWPEQLSDLIKRDSLQGVRLRDRAFRNEVFSDPDRRSGSPLCRISEPRRS